MRIIRSILAVVLTISLVASCRSWRVLTGIMIPKQILRLLRDAIKEMDVDAADEIIRQLKRFAYSESIMTDVMENLCLAVTNLDEEQVVIWTDRFEQELEENA